MKPTFVAVIALIAVGAGFFGGVMYQKTRPISLTVLQNLSPDQRREFMQGMFVRGQNGQGGRGPGGMGGGVAGEVLLKDASSFTLKLNDGGSKIIFYSASTSVGKMEAGSINDVAVGKNVVVNGTTNADGSVTANMVQLRSGGPMLAPRGIQRDGQNR